MKENVILRVLCALSVPTKPAPEIVFCSECQDLAFGRVDDTPLCLACMLSSLERVEALQGDPC